MANISDISDVYIPVITVDGPAGSGKGTLSRLLAEKLHWHYLDSGVLYRVLALAALGEKLSENNEKALEKLAENLEVEFMPPSILLAKQDVSDAVRSPECGSFASRISSCIGVRKALLERQRAFRQPPGLVADGRDMGTVVFPEADFKVFLEASIEVRAERRFLELQEKKINVSLERVLADIAERDERDRQRTAAPLRPAEDAFVLDTTLLSIPAVLDIIMQKYFIFKSRLFN